MAGFINPDDRLSQAMDLVWDRGAQSVKDPNLWAESGFARERQMVTTGGRVPRVNSTHHIAPWNGDRISQGISYSAYTWASKKFESTLGIDRDDLSDLSRIADLFDGFDAMGQAKAKFRNEMVFGFAEAALTASTYTYSKLGQDATFSTIGYDGVSLFGVHTNGAAQTFTNVDSSGSGNQYWYLLADGGVPPVILGKYREFQFLEFGEETTVQVNNERRWGQDGRFALAAGDPRSIYASSLALTVGNVQAAMNTMASWENEDGSPARIQPSRIIVPTASQFDAREVVKPINDSGETNVMQGILDIVVVPYLTAVAP